MLAPNLFDADDQLILSAAPPLPETKMMCAELAQRALDDFSCRTIAVAALLQNVKDAQTRNYFLRRAEHHQRIVATLTRLLEYLRSREPQLGLGLSI